VTYKQGIRARGHMMINHFSRIHPHFFEKHFETSTHQESLAFRVALDA
jgi:hypothetical protein